MNRKIIIFSVIGIVIGMVVVLLLFQNTQPKIEMVSSEFTYDSNSDIKGSLEAHNITMSNPLKIEGDRIDKYCSFFGDSSIQEKIKYCTSTELKDSTGNFLGNIHMIGNEQSPEMIMAVVQSDPFISQEDDLVLIFESVIENVVCDCWEEVKPGGFSSVSAWIDAAKKHHLEAKRTTSKSEVSGLAQKEILLEITTNNNGYLWKFLVDK